MSTQRRVFPESFKREAVLRRWMTQFGAQATGAQATGAKGLHADEVSLHLSTPLKRWSPGRR